MDTQHKLIDLLSDFDTAMLVTRGDDGSLDALPMAVAQVEDDGRIWFVTDHNSGKIADLMLDKDVAVTMQSSSKFVSLSGTASPVDDRAKLNELWSETWKVWFPEGKASDSIVLLRIEPARGEYWDNSGLNGVKYLLKAGKAYLQGKRPETDVTINASVSLYWIFQKSSACISHLMVNQHVLDHRLDRLRVSCRVDCSRERTGPAANGLHENDAAWCGRFIRRWCNRILASGRLIDSVKRLDRVGCWSDHSAHYFRPARQVHRVVAFTRDFRMEHCQHLSRSSFLGVDAVMRAWFRAPKLN